jgi:serine/threonine-protein kinase
MALSPGTRVGPYEVIAPLGAGGMREVYRARDPQLRREVAVKVLPTERAADPARRARLLAEARAAAALNHPNICTIYEVGEADSCAYIAMELVDGRPLSERLDAGPLPVEEVLRYGRQLADAVAHAHERGVVHRDLKAANVMALPDGRVKVLDFGLAKHAAEAPVDVTTQQSLTDAGAVLGTLVYMSPEQLRGQPVDRCSDIWALGIILYEMAAGVRPFQGGTGFEVSSAIFRDVPPPLPGKEPRALDAAVRRCLEKDPERRYQQAGELRAALEAVANGTATASTLPARPRSAPRGVLRPALVAMAAAAVAAALFGWLRMRTVAPRPAAAIQSLAVLPLENLSRDPEEEYFAAGMHEALITDLSRIGLTKVIAKATADTFKGTTAAPADIARTLGVDALITGSVLRASGRVQVSAQLVSVASGAVLWANRYERGAGDVLSLQNELVAAIAREVRATISPEEAARLAEPAPRVNPAAHDAYLKARSLFASMTSTADPKYLDAAIVEFERAIAIDPSYAPSHAGLSLAYQTASQGSWRSPQETFPKARAAALKAIELDDRLAVAHAALAGAFLWFDWNWTGAEHESERALTLNPESVEALTAAEVYATLISRRRDDAARLSQRIIDIDPLNPFSRLQPAWVALFSKRYDEAIDKAKTLVELSPNNLMGPAFLAAAYAVKRDDAEVVKQCGRVLEMLSGAFVMQFIGECAGNLGLVGRTAEARRLLQRLEHPPRGVWLDPLSMGDAYAGVGDADRAVEWYQRGLDQRSPTMIYLNVHHAADRIRSDARFQTVLRQMNFPP